MKPVLLCVVAVCGGWFAGPGAATAQATKDPAPVPSPAFRPYLAGGFNVLVHAGLWTGEVPARPEESEYMWGGGDRYTGVGFGINVDYHLSRYLAAHFDMTHYTLNSPVAYEGGFSDGWWIESVSNFTVERVGPFEEDVNYWRNATGMRLGVKGFFLRTGTVDAWAGVYAGFHTWEIRLLNDQKTRKYGESRGTVTSLHPFNLGVDLWNAARTLGVTVSVESGSPLTGAYEIENCLVNGWTYTDGSGEHMMGPWRAAASLNFVSPWKD